MLKTHRHTISPHTITLISVAVAILIIALGAAIYLRMAPSALPVQVSVQNPALVHPTKAPAFGGMSPDERDELVNPIGAPALAAPNLAPVSAVSIYRSEETLQRWLDEAYEQHNTARVEELQRILNGRYERRCCGFPY